MAFDFEEMLQKIKDRQWALADVDWNAPGADRIRDAQRPKLRAFMADLVWIENVGARGFAALARRAPSETLAEIYKYFHAEEQRHANAELALMRRWGMLEDGQVPEPNINIRLAIEWLDRYADELPLASLGAVIPALEVALDGALVKFLLDEVDDPICHEVFRLINADESRHLAVDFEVLDLIGSSPRRRLWLRGVTTTLQPKALLGMLAYIPLLNRMRDNVVAMGLDEKRLYHAMSRYGMTGDRSPHTRRVPGYQLLKRHTAMAIDRSHPYHHFADFMVRATARIPSRWLGPTPSWASELTCEPVAP